jgi:hypothetical protein
MKAYIILFMSMFIASGVIAQNDRGDRDDKIKALKVAFITEELDLSSESSEKFWPIYNSHHKAEREIKGKFYPKNKMEDMSDEEAMAFIDNRIKMEEQLLVLNKQYIADLKMVLEPKQIARLYGLEREFKRKMLRSIQDKRKGNKKTQKGLEQNR